MSSNSPPHAPAKLKRLIRERGLELGFDKVGFSPFRLDEEAPRLEEWLRRGYHGEMKWMGREPARRTDTTQSLSEAQTVVCCALNYYQGPPPAPPSQHGIIASYARGEDYHRVLGSRLETLAAFIEERCGVATKIYVDTGPILEKAYAVAAGLGWLGKHSNLISPRGSSWFLLGEILIPLLLPPDEPIKDHCGTCSRCIEACPTDAIVEPYVVDSRLCISYLTIELRGYIPRNLRASIGQRIYGCDECQDVCPWNRFAKKSEESQFLPREPLASTDLVSLLKLSREDYLAATRRSAVRRSRYAGFLRNVAVALGNAGDPSALPALLDALHHEEPLVRGHAAWALGRLGAPEARAALTSRLRSEEDPQVQEEIRRALHELDRGAGRLSESR
jgi:epoxyqueuosine reductase